MLDSPYRAPEQDFTPPISTSVPGTPQTSPLGARPSRRRALVGLAPSGGQISTGATRHAVANSSTGVGGPLAMTIFTRPQWCIEPLRPHHEAATKPVWADVASDGGRADHAACPRRLVGLSVPLAAARAGALQVVAARCRAVPRASIESVGGEASVNRSRGGHGRSAMVAPL